MSDSAVVRVFRFDPAIDKEARYETYNGIPYTDRTVLEVVETIYEEFDSSLAFRRGCINGTCGGCGVVVNGEPVLACQTFAEKEMVIEPHPKFHIIKDLVVDFDRMKG